MAVHTRRAPDPQGTLERLREPLAKLAAAHSLVVEPGRMVLELRPPGMDKGHALDLFLAERAARSVMFVGDDLGRPAGLRGGAGLGGCPVWPCAAALRR
ncbi:trehalose-phosphatase [Nonomuraea dietziae]|uniref:trehalose-phosphatase n=1 Tax=Nonomuraea dietziae TaxID=65515 RepID=UPI0031D4304D